MQGCSFSVLCGVRRASFVGVFSAMGLWLFVSCSPGPATEQVTSDAAEGKASVEPRAEPALEPVEVVKESIVERMPESTSESKAERVLEPRSESSVEPTTEPTQDIGVEPQDAGLDGGSLEKIPEAVAETKPERPRGECREGETRACYSGIPGTRKKGICRDGRQACHKTKWGPCLNSVLPQTETCDGKDNDCNGTVDDNCCSSFSHSKTWFATRTEIAAISFSPDGLNVAVAYSDSYTRVWRLSDFRLLYRYNFVYNQPARSVDWSPDGKLLVASGEGDYFRILTLRLSRYKYTFRGHVSYVTHVRFSPDGKYIASGGSDGTVRLWDVATGKELRVWKKHTQPISGLSFSPNSKQVVSGSDDKSIYVWSIASNNPALTLKGHKDLITDTWFSPDGTLIASSSFDKEIRLWSASTGKLVRTLKGHTKFVTSLSFSPDGKTLASTAFKESPRLWKVSDGSFVRSLSMYGKGLEVNTIKYHPQGRMVASGGSDGKVRLWNAARDIKLREGLGPEISAIALHPKQPWIVLGRDNWDVQIWNYKTGTFLQGLSGHTSYIRASFFTQDGKFLVTAAYDGQMKWWDTQTWTVVRTVAVSSPVRAVRWIERVPGGKYFASVSDERRLRIWKLSDGSLYKRMGTAKDARKTTLYSIATHYKGDLIATGASSADPTIRIWSIKSGTIVRVLQGHRSSVLSLSFHPTSDILASAGTSDRTIRLWDAVTGQSRKILFRGGVGENMLAVRYSPDGKWLAALAELGTVYLFDTQTYKQVAKLRFKASYVLVMKWTPDSKKLFVTTREGFVNAWNVTPTSCHP